MYFYFFILVHSGCLYNLQFIIIDWYMKSQGGDGNIKVLTDVDPAQIHVDLAC